MIRARLSRSQAAKARRKLGCPRRSAATAGLGWRPTVTWVGGVGSALAAIALFRVSQSAPGVLWVPLLLEGIYSLLGPTIGHAGVVLVDAGLYLLGAVITHLFLRTDRDPGDQRPTATAVRHREAISA